MRKPGDSVRLIQRILKSALVLAIAISPAAAAFSATEDEKLIASDPKTWGNFGSSVAISGDTLAVGARQDDENGYGSGAVYVFFRNGNTWIQQTKLTPSDAAVDDNFGESVAIVGDTLLIGTRMDNQELGAAYVFTRSGTTWTEEAKLVASDTAIGDNFGTSVALSGNTALIGAYYDDDDGQNSGSAYVFTRSGTAWTEEAKLTASDAFLGDDFGRMVAISGDTCVIGAGYEGWENGYFSGVGAAYVFTRIGTTWTEEAKLKASDPVDITFGTTVAISGDTAFIGTPHFTPSPGYVYVFTRTGTTWTEEQKLAASDGNGGDNFGFSLTVSGDTAVIGAWVDDSRTGSAYLFSRSGTTWTEDDKLTASDRDIGDDFGFSVAFSGGIAVVGAQGDSDNGQYSGSAYVFGLDPDADGDGVPDDIDCNSNSDLSPTVVIDGIDTGVPNTLFDDGCSIADDIAAIAAAANNHGQFLSTLAKYLNDLKKAGVITGKQKGAIQKAAAGANIP